MLNDKIAATILKLFKLNAYKTGINKINSLNAFLNPWITSIRNVYSKWYLVKVLFELILNTAVSTKIWVILYAILKIIL